MSQHVPEDLLQAFVDGDVGEQLAIHIAEHVDACPSCATRAAGLEPLAAAFAAVTDPVPPPELVARVLAAAPVEEPERLPTQEIAIGALLLAGATLLLIGLDGPLAMAADLGVALNAAIALTRSLTIAVSSFQLTLGVATVATLGALLVTLHFASSERVLPRGFLRRIA
ncbi:MAG: zf-HC2 domain-containing protein [Alphaproteobacteria bacterium]|nr:zf-HC2 domain-containing protein [Alphaproteobacteria bacterium]